MAKAPSLRSALVQRVVWRAVVLDEGHVIKNRETEIAQTVRKMHFCTALLLTGTPLQNNLSELWGLLNFLYPAAFPCRDAFDAAYDLGRGVVDKAALGAARRLLGALMLRRLKADVEKGLPPKLETVVHCPLSHCQLFWYKALLLKDRDQLKLDDRGPAAGGYKSLVNLLMQLRKTCCHPFLFADAEGCDPGETTLEELVAASGKLRVLDRLLVKLHARKHRVVVFSQFASMVDVLDDYCALRGWPFCRLTGSTNRVQRVVNVRAFNEPSSPLFLFLMTTRAGGLGINLQSADTVVLYDSDWNPQADLQAMARVHRLGQTKPVHIYRLCSQGTAEERVLQRSQKKLFLSNMVNAAQQLGHDDAAVDDDDVGRLGGAEVLSMLRFGAASMFRGETNREPTDAELEGIIDRTRTGGAEETSGGLVGGVEASADTFDTSEEFVSTRELFGAEVKAPPRISHRDISEQWKHVVDGRRERKQRIKMVEGKGTGYGGAVPVLACNDYELEAGEASVFDRELKGANSDGAFAVQKRAMVIAGRDYAHEAEPLCCFGTGKRTSGPVLECAFCPMVFHKACAARGGYEDAGHLAAGKWRCPQHSCDVCARSTSAAGGLLFRCEACPATLCEDCLPEAATVVGEPPPRRRGVPQQSAACYIRCSPKCDAIMAAREDSSRPSEEPTFAPLDLPPLEVDDRDEFAEAFLSERAFGDGRPESFKERAAAAAADDVRLFDADLAATCADCGDGDEDAYDGEPRFRVAIKFRGGAPITAAAKTLARRNAAGRNVGRASLSHLPVRRPPGRAGGRRPGTM
ncbi:helicase [Aureococcus anophagefferens]|nr:helicase [Aureococcus anophagefferens]